MAAKTKPDASVAAAVYRTLAEDFPPDAINWCSACHWTGPEAIDTKDVDYTHEATWTATREPRKIRDFVRSIKDDPSSLKPIILVKTPGKDTYDVLDGHHRALAFKEAGVPAPAYIATVGSDTGPWDSMHSSQYTGPSKIKVARVNATDDGDATITLTRRDREAVRMSVVEVNPDPGPTGSDQLNDAAIGIVRNALGAYLTVTRPEPPHEFALPGGVVENGENVGMAMCRELLEETGIKVGSSTLATTLKSPIDGRKVHVFVVNAYTGDAAALEAGTRIQWMTAEQLLTQSKLYKASVESLMEAKVLCDRGVGDVHTPAAVGDKDKPMTFALISSAKRSALPDSAFGWPEKRSFPLDTAARTRNAAARLAQGVKQGRIPADRAAKIHARIKAAGKKFGIDIADMSDHEPQTSGGGSSGRISVRADLAHGGSLHVTHHNMNETQRVDDLGTGIFRLSDVRRIRQGDEVDPAAVGVKLMGPTTWGDGSPVKLVWVQLAEVGAWKGHVAGPFEMTPKTFDEVVRNFDDRGLPVAGDYEHASESDPTEGSVPQGGAPATGWAHRLENRGIGGLWGLVEWLEKARQQIKSGEYAFLSPAIRFGAKDPQTGQAIGARLSSFAITNSPFLTNIGRLHAARDGGGAGTAVALKSPLDRPLHKASEYLPALKQALKLDPLCSLQECSDKLSRLRECCMTAGTMDGTYMGEDLGAYTSQLRAMAGAQLGMTGDDLFDLFEDMIDEAMEEHAREYHGGQSPNTDEDMTMADKTASELTTLLTEKTTELGTVTGKLTTATTELAAMTTKFTEQSGALTTMTARAEAAEKALELSTANLKLKTDELTARDAELVTMKDAEKVRADKAIVDEVDIAYLAYKDQRKLTDDSKASMLVVARADIVQFRKDYPPVAAHQAYLLRQVTPGEARPPVNPADVPGAVKSYEEQIAALQAKGMSYSAAQLHLSTLK